MSDNRLRLPPAKTGNPEVDRVFLDANHNIARVVNETADRLDGFVSAGVTANVQVEKPGGGTRTLHFVGGLYTGYTDS